MSLIEFIYLSVYVGIALGLGVVLFLILGLALHCERRWGHLIMPTVAAAMVGGIAVSAALSGRNLALASKSIERISQGAGGGGVMRMITPILLGLCIAKILGAWIHRDEKSVSTAGRGVIFGLMAFLVADNLVSSAVGTSPVFVHGLLYPPLLFAAVWFSRGEDYRLLFSVVKFSLYALMAGSLLAAVALPRLAIEPNYQGFLPGISFRLWGLGYNANSIGPLALIALVLEYTVPTRIRLVQLAGVAMTLLVLLLAQSKTAWGATAFVFGVILWYRFGRNETGKIRPVFVLATVWGLAAGLALLLVVDVGAAWDRFVSSSTGYNLATGTGRLQIWEAALTEWQNNIFFGYGPEIWGPEFRMKIGMPFAFSAHNQMLQTLSKSGLLGLSALLIYLVCLFTATRKVAVATGGVAMALLLLTLVRSLTEVPLALEGFYNGEVLTHMLLVALVLKTTFRQSSGNAAAARNGQAW